MTEAEKTLSIFARATEERLVELINGLESPDGAWPELAGAMAYSLLGGGKRIRAALLLGTYAMFAGDYKSALNFAAALETVHAYSLIHDDLPCMDDDDTRRGKPSCHIAFGEATALLAGDALLNLAFEVMALKENEAYFGAEKTLSALRLLAEAAGSRGMVSGQARDLAYENRPGDVTAEVLTGINRLKTGALIRAACMIGAELGGADGAAKEAVGAYAEKLGLAFQIRDDVLDVTGDPDRLGKPTGSDDANNKTTYAKLYGVKKAAELAESLTREAVEALDLLQPGREAGFLRGLARLLSLRNV